MKKFAIAAVIGLSITATSAPAQSLQPQMSSQDISTQMQVESGHVIVPILTMIFLLLAAGSSASPAPEL